MEDIFERLKQSKFRNSFHLREKERKYIEEKGWKTIESHCKDFIEKKLADPSTFNDGKQTPTQGHPVFRAQHATATCCRGCLSKWHHISPLHILTQNEKDYIFDIIMSWLHTEMNEKK